MFKIDTVNRSLHLCLIIFKRTRRYIRETLLERTVTLLILINIFQVLSSEEMSDKILKATVLNSQMMDSIIDSHFDKAIEIYKKGAEDRNFDEKSDVTSSLISIASKDLLTYCERLARRKKVISGQYNNYLIKDIDEKGSWVSFVNDFNIERRKYQAGETFNDGKIKLILVGKDNLIVIELLSDKQSYLLPLKPAVSAPFVQPPPLLLAKPAQAGAMTPNEEESVNFLINLIINIMEDAVLIADFEAASALSNKLVETLKPRKLADNFGNLKELNDLSYFCYLCNMRKLSRSKCQEVYSINDIDKNNKWVIFKNDQEKRRYRVGEEYNWGKIISITEGRQLLIEASFYRNRYIFNLDYGVVTEHK